MAKKKSRFRSEVGKDDLTNRTEQSYNTMESSGKYNDYFTDDMPLKKWYCNEGDHAVDIIPFIAGDNHPNVAPGKGTHNVDIFVHFGIGVTESSYICPARMGMGKCPICEYQSELRKQPNYDEKLVRSLNAKRRVVYNVLVYDTPADENEGVMIWEASHHLSEKNIMAISRNKRDGGWVDWASPDIGKTVEFERKGKGITTDYKGFVFRDRREPISDETLDDTIDISEYLDFKTYEELVEILGDTTITTDEPLEDEETYEEVVERTPRRSVRQTSRTEKEPEPEKEVEKEEDPAPRSRRSSRRSSRSEAKEESKEEKAETGTSLRRRSRRK